MSAKDAFCMLSTKTAEFIVSRRTWLASPPAPTTPGRCLEQEVPDWQEWPGELERVLRLLALAGAEPSHRPRRLGGEVGVSDRAHTSGVSARRDLMKREKRCAQLEQNPEVPAGSDLLTQRLRHLIDCPARPESRGDSQGLSRPSDVTHSGGMRLRWPGWEVACMNKLSLSALLSRSLTSSETVRKPRTIFYIRRKEWAKFNGQYGIFLNTMKTEFYYSIFLIYLWYHQNHLESTQKF